MLQLHHPGISHSHSVQMNRWLLKKVPAVHQNITLLSTSHTPLRSEARQCKDNHWDLKGKH